jgi:LacI family transcriptional regulator, repressor for deo operon, udp, cdd, tsx, nupC, and nupG
MDKRSTILILTRPEEHFLDSFYFKKIKYGIDIALGDDQYNITMIDQRTDLKDFLASQAVTPSGIISVAPHVNDDSVEQLKSVNLPSVLINCRAEGLSWADVDNVYGARVMTEHLINMGHKDMLILTGFMESQNSIDRLKGFHKALGLRGIDYNPEMVINCDFSIMVSYNKMKEFLSREAVPKFSAIFATNDLMAVGAIRALMDRNIRVPEDVAVVGFDDFEFSSSFIVPLTTYRQPFYNVAFVATRFLLRQILTQFQDIRPQQAELAGEIIIRDSCGFKLRQTV